MGKSPSFVVPCTNLRNLFVRLINEINFLSWNPYLCRKDKLMHGFVWFCLVNVCVFSNSENIGLANENKNSKMKPNKEKSNSAFSLVFGFFVLDSFTVRVKHYLCVQWLVTGEHIASNISWLAKQSEIHCENWRKTHTHLLCQPKRYQPKNILRNWQKLNKTTQLIPTWKE